jgi:dTDP-4-dehydrorhamnose reductase
MKLLCIGKTGQVARALSERAEARGIDLISVGRPDLDLLDQSSIVSAVDANEPSLIINTAAFTEVDAAEQDEIAAYDLNEDAPATLARIAAERNIRLIHFSTDYVFDGASPHPYPEDAPTNPLGVYGASKLAGERAVLAASEQNIVLRTSWIYSPFGQNFAKTMLRLAKNRDEISVVSDQCGSPTNALDLADGTLSLCDALLTETSIQLGGLFHMTSMDSTSWAAFAQAIFEESRKFGGPNATVKPIASESFPTATQRPMNSRLSCEKLSSTFGITLPEWQKSVPSTIQRILIEGVGSE